MPTTRTRPIPASKRTLTVAEAAERLRVTRQTIRIWLKEKRLNGDRFGWQWRIPEVEIDRRLGLGAPTKRPAPGVKG